jgi:hypothetical protein
MRRSSSHDIGETLDQYVVILLQRRVSQIRRVYMVRCCSRDFDALNFDSDVVTRVEDV